jgi:hypothetical protein
MRGEGEDLDRKPEKAIACGTTASFKFKARP